MSGMSFFFCSFYFFFVGGGGGLPAVFHFFGFRQKSRLLNSLCQYSIRTCEDKRPLFDS